MAMKPLKTAHDKYCCYKKEYQKYVHPRSAARRESPNYCTALCWG